MRWRVYEDISLRMLPDVLLAELPAKDKLVRLQPSTSALQPRRVGYCKSLHVNINVCKCVCPGVRASATTAARHASKQEEKIWWFPKINKGSPI